MKTRREKLEVDVFLHHVLLKDLLGFVVELLEVGLELARFQEGNYALIPRQVCQYQPAMVKGHLDQERANN